MRIFLIAALIAILQVEVALIVWGMKNTTEELFWRTMPKPLPSFYRDEPPIDAWMDI